ncbi:hypothetical protein [Paenibacillus sp. FSL L8-0494]|uniref:hypothetical protein n=1 Tax=Paenibacillus sp. FSL L8-0494 TaxID=2975352 RepID=UPI0030F79C6A
MKLLNQFKEVMDRSTEANGNCFALNITNTEASIIGASNKPLSSHSGIVVLRLNGQYHIKGWLDGYYYESSNLENVDSSKPIQIGVDRNKVNNTKVYVSYDTTITKFSAQSNMTSDCSISVFWEIESQACLTSCIYDPVREEVIREVVSAGSEPLKKFLRAEILQKLQPFTSSVADTSVHLEDSDEFEGEMDIHESTYSTIFQR